MANVIELREGNSMCRKLIRMLIPSHGDAYEQQLIHNPDLKSLSEAELTALRAKFQVYDSINDPCFRHWFWRIAKARYVNGKVLG